LLRSTPSIASLEKEFPVIPSTATTEIIQKAKIEATASSGGGISKKINDLQSYGTMGGTAVVSFAISHIPLLGPALAKAFDIGAGMGIDAIYATLLENSKSREERIVNSLFLLERSLAASMRQAWNTVHDYDKKAGVKAEVECDDCQDAFKEARYAALAQDCVEDIEAGCLALEQLVKDLKADVSILKGKVDQRVTRMVSRIDNFRDNHPDRACMGTQRCYWMPMPGTRGSTPFGSYGGKGELHEL
jgi:hypothetical protein